MPTIPAHTDADTTHTTTHGRTIPATHHQAVPVNRPPLPKRLANLTPETIVLAVALLVLVAGSLAMPVLAGLLLGIPLAAALGLGTITGIARVLAA